MMYYFYKLVPPRSTFPMDMTETENVIMEKHFAYWGKLIQERTVVAYGPVMDPNGTYGIAIIAAEDDTAAKHYGEHDPAITAHAGFRFELYQMPDAMVRK